MKLAELLFEGYRGDWAILPATMALYGKRKVDLIGACDEWKNENNTILICIKPDDRNRVCFVSSSGDGLSHYEKDIGKEFSAYHDQTGNSKGRYLVANVVVIKDGKIVKKANDKYLNAKASLAVFK